MGTDYAYISLTKKQDGVYVTYAVCKNADKGYLEQERVLTKLNTDSVFFSVEVNKGAICSFSYSEDNKNYLSVGESFIAKPGRWIGTKLGYFCSRKDKTNDSGFADIDWIRIAATKNK